MDTVSDSFFEHAASAFEAARATIPFPKGVRGVVLDYGEDWAGDPAVWIRVTVDFEPNPSKQSVRVLNEYTNRLRDEMLKRGVRGTVHGWAHHAYQRTRLSRNPATNAIPTDFNGLAFTYAQVSSINFCCVAFRSFPLSPNQSAAGLATSAALSTA